MKKNYETKRTQTVVFIGLITALVTSVTLISAVQYGAGGYFNLGDAVIMILSCISPVRQVLVAAALGSALADVLGGAAVYAIFTAFIKGSEVLVIYALRKILVTKYYPVVFLTGAVFMVVSYAVVDQFLLGTYGFMASLTANAVQGVLAFILPTAIYPFIRKHNFNTKGLTS